eukprot:CAMPEP_0197589882 /NCGR_PEP_ID=MMETSP1326-20131121/10670_1 /TAXON_ID=1155430 /ORGANISM="Genus nov. species nov., Strain RCC2288" /LENGTH=66 /DNA_ID=CAMNT_0043154865 /DNA_START=59 /DNA_END=259 /DNA_ORIENTATION=-
MAEANDALLLAARKAPRAGVSAPRTAGGNANDALTLAARDATRAEASASSMAEANVALFAAARNQL